MGFPGDTGERRTLLQAGRAATSSAVARAPRRSTSELGDVGRGAVRESGLQREEAGPGLRSPVGFGDKMPWRHLMWAQVWRGGDSRQGTEEFPRTILGRRGAVKGCRVQYSQEEVGSRPGGRVMMVLVCRCCFGFSRIVGTWPP